MSEHTPTPWRAGANTHPMSENFMQAAIGAEGYEDAIAIFPDSEHDSAANQEFVLRAVNAHDDLLETLRNAPSLGRREPILNRWFDKVALPAIAKAEAPNP